MASAAPLQIRVTKPATADCPGCEHPIPMDESLDERVVALDPETITFLCPVCSRALVLTVGAGFRPRVKLGVLELKISFHLVEEGWQ